MDLAELDSRKLKILAAIVEIYIATGEPVGSKLLSQELDIKVSPATIRNDMAALFDMGLLEQPYTSAGRVPSHLGYRVYIDKLMCCRPMTQKEKDEIDAMFNIRDPDPDRLLEDAARALAEYTGCASISSTITPVTVFVKRIEVIPAGIRTVVILLIASNGTIKNKVCRVPFHVTQEIIAFFNKYANGRLAGRSLNEITSAYISSVAVSLGEYSRVFTPVLGAIFELCKEINDGQFFVDGSTNLLAYEEFEKIGHDLLTFLQRKDELTKLMNGAKGHVTITIGRENNSEELTGSTVVISKYNIGHYDSGAIGIIGPVRIDYARIIPHLVYFADTLGKLLSETFEQAEQPDPQGRQGGAGEGTPPADPSRTA